MKPILIFGLIAITFSSVFSQSEYYYSENFTAFCNESDNLNSIPTFVYLENDSIIIKDKIYNQCCPGFALKISEIINDTIFVSFTDTATLMCDCVCEFDVTLNAGRSLVESLTIIYNGVTFQIHGYDSIMIESKIWSNLSGGYGVEMIECCYSNTFLKIETDPLINTIDEKQILASKDSLRTWTKIGNIKESEKKVYFRDLHNNQGLLYDFGAKKGELINIVNYAQNIDPDTITVRVENIDTLEYLGIRRQRFEVRNTVGGQKDYWISGIGSVKGLLNPCLQLYGGFRELLCVHNEGIQIYQNPNRMTCFVIDTCSKPTADFDFYISESYPIQIDLGSSARYAESIIWKAISAYSLKDTIIGTGENIRIQNPFLFEVRIPDCEGCVSTIAFTQIVINECGKDSITIEVPVENYTNIGGVTFGLIRCYPNPSDGFIKIDYSGEITKLNYSLRNSIGQIIDSGHFNDNKIYLNLEAGIYVLQINKKDKLIFEEKLLIIK